MNNLDQIALFPEDAFEKKWFDFQKEVDLAFYFSDLERLESALKNNKKPKCFEEIILNKLNESFHPTVANFLLNGNFIQNLPSKIYENYLLNTGDENVKPLIWLLNDEKVFWACCEDLFNRSKDKPYVASSCLKYIFKHIKIKSNQIDDNILVEAITNLSKSQTLQKILKTAAQLDADKYRDTITSVFFSFVKVLDERAGLSLKNKKTILDFFNTLLPNTLNNCFIGDDFLRESRNYYYHFPRSSVINLLPYTRNSHIKDFLKLKLGFERDNYNRPNYLNKTTNIRCFLFKDVYKENPSEYTFEVKDNNKMSEDEFFVFTLMGHLKNNDQAISDYLPLNESNKDFLFKNILNLKNPIFIQVLTSLSYPIAKNLKKELMEMGIHWINKFGDYEMRHLSIDNKDVKVMLSDVLIRGAFIDVHSYLMKMLLKDKKMIDFIINSDFLHEAREFAKVFKNSSRVQMIEKAIVNHIKKRNQSNISFNNKKAKLKL